MPKDIELEELEIVRNALRNALRNVSKGPPLPGVHIEALPIYMIGGEPLTVDDTIDWFYYHFCKLAGLEQCGLSVDWDAWMKRFIKQLKKVEGGEDA